VTDYASQILSGNLEEKQKTIPKEKTKDYAKEILSGIKSFEESEFVGGTYQPTGEISTITTKPIKKLIPGEEPGASFTAQMKASFADTPAGRIKAFASSRGIPDSEIVKRYRIGKGGEIEFKTDKGLWQREVWEDPSAKIKNIVAETIAHPGTILGVAGAAGGGVPGAVGGAMLGEVIRKGVGKIIYKEKIEVGGDLIDIGLTGIFALAGEGVSRALGYGINKFIRGKKRILTLAGEEVKKGLLSPADHAKAKYVQTLANMHNMELAPHQLYDKEGMTNLWKYLRKHPLTSDSIRTFENELEMAGTDAIEGFIEKMGGYTKGAYATGKGLQETAENIHGDLIKRRSRLTSRIYKKAYEESPEVDVKSIVDWIDTESKIAKGKIYDHLQKAKKLLLKPELPEEIPAGKIIDPKTGKPIVSAIQNYETGLKQLHQIKMELDELVKSNFPDVESGYQKWIRKNYSEVRTKLKTLMEDASPEYVKANEKFGKLSQPINRLRDSVIGEIEDMAKDRQIARIPHKLLNPQNMPDEELLLEAKKLFQKKDPDLWKEMIGEYIRDTYENLKVTQEGKIVNPLGKLYQKLFGNEKQRKLLWAAMEPGEFKSFSDLMKVFEKASIGMGKESMTAPFQAIEESLGKIPGSKIYRFAMFPRQATVEWFFGKWNDILVHGRQGALAKALTEKDVINNLIKLKHLAPNTQKFLDTLAVLTSSVTKRTLEERP